MVAAETPKILSSPINSRVTSQGISLWPTCTPSASIASAISTLSFIIKGILYFVVISLTFRAKL